MAETELPATLIDRIKCGRAVLFLGSGALFGASIPGKTIPLGNGLRDILNKKFLNNEYKVESLAHVSALAISQTSLREVQDFIRDYFQHLNPAPFHFKIPEFHWRAIFTTNYDRLIEKCYESNSNKLQNYHPILSNSDNFDETRITNDIVPLIKLHGCITRTHEEDLPLILTVDQYNDCLRNRSRLFKHLYELAYENPIIFVGHSLQDPNIREVLLRLKKEVPQGERYYLIKPDIKTAEKEYWAEMKISALDITFQKFIEVIESEISPEGRTLSLVRPNKTHEIQSKFVTQLAPSDELMRFLTDDAEYVTSSSKYIKHSAKDFYRGNDLGWYPLAEDLCIERSILNRIHQSVLEKPEEERITNTELFLIKGEAGSGKTVLLKQLIWGTNDFDIGIFIWIKSGISIDADIIKEISTKCNERVFLIWDDAARNSHEIYKLFDNCKQQDLAVTIITAERYSEWNTRCEDLDEITSDIFKLKYLNESEIQRLIAKLEKYDCLGPNLKDKKHEDRIKEFKEIYGRQLLVALYEATMGEPFEDIICNEYSNIYSESAKEIYLTVCTLNRMRVPVRAGLISRIHGVSFDRFKEEFFKPLEKIVISDGNSDFDMHYKARHPEVADIVFKRVLNDSIERYHEYIRILVKINISYESDRASFRTLIKAKNLHELFPSFDDVNSIYNAALEAIGDDPYLLQQIANFERIRPNGSLTRSIELLEKARELAPYDGSIVHTLAVVWRDRASQEVKDIVTRAKYRGEARALLEFSIRQWGDNNYSNSTLVELALDNLEDLLKDETTRNRSVDKAIRKAEKQLLETKRKFPSDSHIYALEFRFAELLSDNDRAITALEKSYKESNRDPYTATRLASIYKSLGDDNKALEVLKNTLERRPSEHRLNFKYAELLRIIGKSKASELVYYYRRAYTPNDTNYQAQFWHARFLFETHEAANIQSAKLIFSKLRNARVPYESRIEVRDFIGGNDSKTLNLGTLVRKKECYGFISVDGSHEEIFFPMKEVEDDLWNALEKRDRLKFYVGFSFNGPVCCSVSAVSAV